MARQVVKDSEKAEESRRAAEAARAEIDAVLRSLGVPDKYVATLRPFFDRDGRLTQIPAQRAKRLLLLDLLAQRFIPGQLYSETRVNLILGQFNPDWAALRRYLVDEDFLGRRDGFYWRSGGTVDLDRD